MECIVGIVKILSDSRRSLQSILFGPNIKTKRAHIEPLENIRAGVADKQWFHIDNIDKEAINEWIRFTKIKKIEAKKFKFRRALPCSV